MGRRKKEAGTLCLVEFRDGAGRTWTASGVMSGLMPVGVRHPPLSLEDAEEHGLVLVDFKVVKT
jgi:hypothetical protein